MLPYALVSGTCGVTRLNGSNEALAVLDAVGSQPDGDRHAAWQRRLEGVRYPIRFKLIFAGTHRGTHQN
jgi:hypothetical protein